MKNMSRPGMILGMAALALVFTYGQALAVTVTPAPYLSNLTQWKSHYQFPGKHRYRGDRIKKVEFYGFQGKNTMRFRVQVQVDEVHIYGRDRVKRSSPLTSLLVAVLPFDINGNVIFNNCQSGTINYPKPKGGINLVKTYATLNPGVQLNQVKTLLVAVWELGFPNQGQWFKFSDVVPWANIKETGSSKYITLYSRGYDSYNLRSNTIEYKQIGKSLPLISGALVGIRNNSSKIDLTVSNPMFGAIQIPHGSEIKVSYPGKDLLNGWTATSTANIGSVQIIVRYFRQ